MKYKETLYEMAYDVNKMKKSFFEYWQKTIDTVEDDANEPVFISSDNVLASLSGNQGPDAIAYKNIGPDSSVMHPLMARLVLNYSSASRVKKTLEDEKSHYYGIGTVDEWKLWRKIIKGMKSPHHMKKGLI
jgi:phosphoribosyl-AMP cyclohydrolase